MLFLLRIQLILNFVFKIPKIQTIYNLFKKLLHLLSMNTSSNQKPSDIISPQVINVQKLKKSHQEAKSPDTFKHPGELNDPEIVKEHSISSEGR